MTTFAGYVRFTLMELVRLASTPGTIAVFVSQNFC
jgi:hypothetical protein